MRTFTVFAPLLAIAALAVPALASKGSPKPPPLKDLTVPQVKRIFEPLGRNATEFFVNSCEEIVDWTVTNPDPRYASNLLSGKYNTLSAFRNATFNHVNRILVTGPIRLVMVHEPIVAGRWVSIEFQAQQPNGLPPVGDNGVAFDNRYSWTVHLNARNKVDIVRAYIDSAMVRDLIETGHPGGRPPV